MPSSADLSQWRSSTRERLLQRRTVPAKPSRLLTPWCSGMAQTEPLPVLESVAKALVNKAGVLLTAARRQEAIYVCDEVIRRFGKQKSPVLAHMVADAFYVKGGALLEMQRPMESLTPFSEVLQRSSKAEPSSIPGLQAKALLGRGLAFDRLGKSEEALAVYDEIVTRFGEHTDPWVLGPVTSALARKVSILDVAGRQPDALDVHKELVRRVGSAAPSYQELIERSLIERAEFHFISGRYRQAIEATELALARCLPDSLENKLRALAIRAKSRLADDDHGATEGDIVDILATLAELGTLSKELLSALMEFSVGVGYGRMREADRIIAISCPLDGPHNSIGTGGRTPASGRARSGRGCRRYPKGAEISQEWPTARTHRQQQ